MLSDEPEDVERDRAVLARELRLARLALGLTQQGLADAAGIGLRTVRDVERGRVTAPRRDTLERLSRVIGPWTALPREPRSPLPDGPRLPAAGARVPLPVPPADFSGRREELALLSEWGRSGATVLVHGPPGIGKTTLATVAAAQQGAYRADGAFLVELRGGTDSPATLRSALARLLVDLGVGRQRLPAGLGDRLALYRERLAGRRAVLVLDDVLDVAQVDALLPRDPGWWVVLTSRSRLGGLAAIERMHLDVLGDDDGYRLLARIVGAERVERDPATARDIVRLCAGWPLALRIVGSRLASRPAWPLQGMAGRLRLGHRRLGVMRAGDVAVRGAFTVSYRHLPEPGRALFRRLALLPWPGYDLAVAAEVLDVDEHVAAATLAGVVEAGLLQPVPGTDRVRMPDLLGLFGRECAADEDGRQGATTVLDRVRRSLLATVLEVGACFASARMPVPDRRVLGRPRWTPDDAAAALAWLDAERTAIHWAVRQTVRDGRHEEILVVAEALRAYADRNHHAAPWHQLFGLSVAAARHLGDPVREARHRDALGFALKYEARRPREAGPHHERARALYAELGDRVSHAWSTLYTVGSLHRSGRLPEALARVEEAAILFAAVDAPLGTATAGMARGDILRDLGRPARAAQIHREALAELPDPRGGGRVVAALLRYRLGLDLLAIGDLPHAVAVLDGALAEFTALDHPTGTAESISALAEALATAGSPRAVGVAQEAVRRCQELGDLFHEARAWYAWGLVAQASDHGEHRARWRTAARLLAGLDDLESRQLAGRLAGTPST